jgi:hypothetical protein
LQHQLVLRLLGLFKQAITLLGKLALSIGKQTARHDGPFLGHASDVRGTTLLLFPLPPLRVGIPCAIREQPIQIGTVRIAVDEEVQPFAIVLARPLASPHLPSRIIGMEVRTARALTNRNVGSVERRSRRDDARQRVHRNPGMVRVSYSSWLDLKA